MRLRGVICVRAMVPLLRFWNRWRQCMTECSLPRLLELEAVPSLRGAIPGSLGTQAITPGIFIIICHLHLGRVNYILCEKRFRIYMRSNMINEIYIRK